MEELTRLIQEQQDTILQLEAELKNARGAHDISVDRFIKKSRQLEALKDDYEVDMIGLAQYIMDKYVSDETLRATEVVREYLYS
jgi:hypothetical protein